MKVNIEGGEYELLDRMIESQLMGRIDYLQIQFHSISPSSSGAMRRIQRSLKETHKLDFQYVFLWEGWSRKGLC
jgi:hypothetical protein